MVYTKFLQHYDIMQWTNAENRVPPGKETLPPVTARVWASPRPWSDSS